jgi:1,4-dihydroxy-2-naphthoyl-CoA hydrolase
MMPTGDAVTLEWVRGNLPGSLPGDLGVEAISIDDERCIGRMAVDERHLHPGGFVHGGAWVALADTVAAWQTFRHLPAEHGFTTVELKLNVFATGRLGDELTATAEHLHAGRSTHVIEVRVRNGERAVAHLLVTQFVLAPDPAAQGTR